MRKSTKIDLAEAERRALTDIVTDRNSPQKHVWRADALANGTGAGSQRWTAAVRLQAVIVTAAMDEATRSAWCREQGLYLAELDAWKRDSIAGLGEPRVASAAERNVGVVQ